MPEPKLTPLTTEIEEILLAAISPCGLRQTIPETVAAILAAAAGHPPRVLIVIEGGVVNSVLADGQVCVLVKDFDAFKADKQDALDYMVHGAFLPPDAVCNPEALDAARVKDLDRFTENVPTVTCKFCGQPCRADTAHRHQGN